MIGPSGVRAVDTEFYNKRIRAGASTENRTILSCSSTQGLPVSKSISNEDVA